MAEDEGDRPTGGEAGPPPRSGGWIAAALSAVGVRVVGAVLTTVALSVGYMIFNDYVAPPPDLAGRWKFTVVYEDTALARYEGLQVTYQALLIQEGLNLSGAGEKLSDRGLEPMEPVDYSDDRRTNIELVGNIARSYFSPDRLVVHYKEAGRRRQSSTLHQLEYFDAQTMCGCFQSTVADTLGSVWVGAGGRARGPVRAGRETGDVSSRGLRGIGVGEAVVRRPCAARVVGYEARLSGVRRPGGPHVDGDALAEGAERLADPVGGRAVAGVEQPPHHLLVDPERIREGDPRQAALPERARERGLGRDARGHGDLVFAGLGARGLRDRLAVVDATGERFGEGVGGGGQRRIRALPGREALRQVAERDDEFAGSGAGQRGGVDELHGVSWFQRRSAGSRPSCRVMAASRAGPMSLRRSLTTVLRSP